jgi:hypothetical protein
VSIPNAVALDTVLSDPAVIDFFAPRDDARPWVYWYFMDGNLTREGMEADLVAMKQAGIDSVQPAIGHIRCSIRIPRARPSSRAVVSVTICCS